MSTDLVIDQGDDEIIDITVTDPGSPPTATNLSGCKLWFYVKERAADPDAAAIIAKSSPSHGVTVTEPASDGKAVVTIDHTDTVSLSTEVTGRKLVWALQLRDGTVAGRITTLASGSFTINRDLISTVV